MLSLLRNVEKETNSKLRTIKIFHSNDEHGRIEFDDGKYNLYSGMLKTGDYLKDKDYDLLLSAGDMIQGLPLSDTDKGKTIANIAKNIGYQAVAVGNHEFDYGLKHILNLNAELNKDAETMPFLSANIYYAELPADKQVEGYDASKVGQRVFKPYIIRDLGSGIKVAIFGLTTPDTKTTSHPKNSELVNFTDPLTETKKVVAEIKQAHPEISFIINIAHLGKARSVAAWTSEYLAEHNDTDLDLILDGHSHTLVKINNENQPDTYVTQTEAYTKYLGDIELEFDVTTGKIASQKQTLRDIYQVEVATLLEPIDPKSKNQVLLAELKKIFSSENERVVFESPAPFLQVDTLNIDGVPYWRGRILPTTMGVLFANAGAWNFFTSKTWEAIPDVEPGTIDNTFGLFNGGGLRSNLDKGPVKYGDMRAISPFGNRPNVVRVKGDKAKEAILYGISKARSGGFSQLSSNISYKVNIIKKLNPKTQKEEYMWEAIPESIKINGKDFDPNKYYYIATNDYLAYGGDGYTMLNYAKNPESVKMVYEGQSLIQDALKFISKISTKDAKLDPTILEFTLEDYAKDDMLKGQIIDIPEEATKKPVPSAD
ncbi:bifunctional metallophosphatase/5'-nucleotidase [Mycoplasma hafezii]|uniref:bifunctional metallophosphatase/5'-nucleotidase n=1 Tax=Mycoplasma hafezii TaxID=525886 RepID=UPI003CFA8D1F